MVSVVYRGGLVGFNGAFIYETGEPRFVQRLGTHRLKRLVRWFRARQVSLLFFAFVRFLVPFLHFVF